MRLELSHTKPDADGRFTVRLLVSNDSAEPVRLDRRLLYGPHPAAGEPQLLATEPATKRRDATVLLNPWCLYGRDRSFQYPKGQETTFHAYLLGREADGLSPSGPLDRTALAAEAPPLGVTVPE